MFSENLKATRKGKGFSQETLAIHLNVVRQTISKWEKGLSVPDAEMLIRLAETLETSVATLLGGTMETSEDRDVISQQLEQLNTLLAEKNRRSRRIWKTILIVALSVIAISILLMVFSMAK